MINRPMTEYTRPPRQVRLSVVAALVGSGAPTAHATADECRLAEALRGTPGEPGGAPGPDAPAIADLLRLAEGHTVVWFLRRRPAAGLPDP